MLIKRGIVYLYPKGQAGIKFLDAEVHTFPTPDTDGGFQFTFSEPNIPGRQLAKTNLEFLYTEKISN